MRKEERENMLSEMPPPMPEDMPDDENGQRPELTPMMMINDIARVSRRVVRSKEGDLSESARQLLHHLAFRDGKTQLDLVKVSHFKAPTVSVTLQKLEQDGYVVRKSDDKDLRQVRVYLTEKGRQHNEEIREGLDRLDSHIMSCLSEQEIQTLTEILKKMGHHLMESKEYCPFEMRKKSQDE